MGKVEGIVWVRKERQHGEGRRHCVGQEVEEREETANGKVFEACVVPACVYGLGTRALSWRREEKLQLAENSCIGRICETK